VAFAYQVDGQETSNHELRDMGNIPAYAPGITLVIVMWAADGPGGMSNVFGDHLWSTLEDISVISALATNIRDHHSPGSNRELEYR
jgi:hypothetical protein